MAKLHWHDEYANIPNIEDTKSYACEVVKEWMRWVQNGMKLPVKCLEERPYNTSVGEKYRSVTWSKTDYSFHLNSNEENHLFDIRSLHIAVFKSNQLDNVFLSDVTVHLNEGKEVLFANLYFELGGNNID